ncbi:MAG: outer membrane protein assembly factor BamB [Planctomycetota bacterium]|jgi:outer membrane protein assembly factor BamB
MRIARLLTPLTLGLLCASARAVAAPVTPQEFQAEEVLAFQIYDTQAARAIQEEALEHFEAGRLREGLAQLQLLIESHRGAVLAAEHPRAEGAPRKSVGKVHAGASYWAYSQLFDVTEEAAELYRERYEGRAQKALEHAIARGDVAELVSLSTRWPLTRAAERAWWAIGDLETESSRPEEGRVAWSRAVALALGNPKAAPRDAGAWIEALASIEASAPGSARLPGIQTRIRLVLEQLSTIDEAPKPDPSDPSDTSAVSKWATALGGADDLGRPFSDQTESWPRGFELPLHPFRSGNYALYPARSGDTVFINTSRQVLAVEAFTGDEIWGSSPRDLGWETRASVNSEFTRGIDTKSNLQAPAATLDTVVAALQVPFLFMSSDSFKDLEIITPIPERRLMAFDAKTGDVLWANMPPEDWDGESGDYAARVNVVGPPVIIGNRVLVPTARMRGRIEFHVGCFDLDTGATLWYTPLITGQRELNMFGREEVEFCAPPVVIAGDRVVVQTQLGTVACLDLFTGNVLWQSLYPQLSITEPNYYRSGSMASVWRNAPPAVTEHTVVSTPVDSRYLMGFDLESGSVLWQLDYSGLSDAMNAGRSRNPLQYLIGADEEHVILAGRRVASFRTATGSLTNAPPTMLHWSWPADEPLSSNQPRAVMDEERIFVPRESTLVAVDRATGRLETEFDWEGHRGNLMLSDGQLFSLGPRQLWGFFEWDAMLTRAKAKLAKAPTDERTMVSYARLLMQRGVSARRNGGSNELLASLRSLRQSRQVLDTFLDGAKPSSEVQKTIYSVLHEQATSQRLGADGRAALGSLKEALTLATTSRQRLDTLMVTQALLRDRDEPRRRLVLTQLVDDFAAIETVFQILDQGWVAGDGSWKGRLEPAAVSLAQDKDIPMTLMPIGLWGLIERAESRGMDRSASAKAATFADLHRILADYPDEPFRGDLALTWASERIGEHLTAGNGLGYERFSKESEELLAVATRDADLDALAQVTELYPHSPAAARANDTRIEICLERGDTALVASIVLGELGDDWTTDKATTRQVSNLVRLAEVVGESGNLELRAGLAQRLAEYHGQLRVDSLTLGQRSVKQLAQTWQDERHAIELSPPPVVFGPNPLYTESLKEGLEFLGHVRPRDDSQRTFSIFVGRRQHSISQHLYAFHKDSSEPIWSVRSLGAAYTGPYPQHIRPSNGLVHVAGVERLATLDATDGRELWRWSLDGSSNIKHIHTSGGVVIAVIERPRSQNRTARTMVALDAVTGAELWRLGGIDGSFNQRPVVGDGYVVLLPRNQGSAETVDLYTGCRVSRFNVGRIHTFDARAAWIEEGQLILPSFIRAPRQQENRVQGFELSTGEVAWQAEIPAGYEIHRVLHHAGKTLLQLNSETEDDETAPSLFRLNVRLGSLDQNPLAELSAGAEFIGLARYDAAELQSPVLLAFVRGASGGDRLQAVDVRFGRRWNVPLPEGFRATYATDLPHPVSSESTLALALSGEPKPRGSRSQIGVLFFDRKTGQTTGKWMIPTEFVRLGDLQLHGLHTTLLVSGLHKTELLK